MYFSETAYLKKILFFIKQIYAIFYSDNLRTCLVQIMGHLWFMSDPRDLNGNTRKT